MSQMKSSYTAQDRMSPVSPFNKPSDINIPQTDVMKKPGHKREHSSPNSVNFLEEGSLSPTKKAGLKKNNIIKTDCSTVRRQWRCVSPTDRFRNETPSAILKKNYYHMYLAECLSQVPSEVL